MLCASSLAVRLRLLGPAQLRVTEITSTPLFQSHHHSKTGSFNPYRSRTTLSAPAWPPRRRWRRAVAPGVRSIRNMVPNVTMTDHQHHRIGRDLRHTIMTDPVSPALATMIDSHGTASSVLRIHLRPAFPATLEHPFLSRSGPGRLAI